MRSTAVSPVCLQVRHTTHMTILLNACKHCCLKTVIHKVSSAVFSCCATFLWCCKHMFAITCMQSLVCKHMSATHICSDMSANTCMQSHVHNHMHAITCMQTHDCSHVHANTWLQLHVCNHMRAITCLPHLVAGSSLKAPKLF